MFGSLLKHKWMHLFVWVTKRGVASAIPRKPLDEWSASVYTCEARLLRKSLQESTIRNFKLKSQWRWKFTYKLWKIAWIQKLLFWKNWWLNESINAIIRLLKNFVSMFYIVIVETRIQSPFQSKFYKFYITSYNSWTNYFPSCFLFLLVEKTTVLKFAISRRVQFLVSAIMISDKEIWCWWYSVKVQICRLMIIFIGNILTIFFKINKGCLIMYN